MKIKSLHTEAPQEAKNIQKTSHKEYDKYGKLKNNHYVEFTVVGKNRSWKDFMPLKDFKRLNPEITIE